jgi:uncharacterized protein
LVRNLSGFVRFLPIASLFHTQVINVESIGRDCGVARSTVEGYLQILEDTLLGFRLPAYETKLRVRQKVHPKLYWSDPGLVRATKKQLGNVAIEEKGSLFEGFIAHVLKSSHELGHFDYDRLSYWSAGKNSIEVDFIIERGKDSFGIEVEAGTRSNRNWFSGLNALQTTGKFKRTLLVYLAHRRFKHSSGVEVLPLKDFLSEFTKL